MVITSDNYSTKSTYIVTVPTTNKEPYFHLQYWHFLPQLQHLFHSFRYQFHFQ